MSFDKALFASKDHDWRTPDWLFEELDQKYRFDLDAAASEANSKCSQFLTKEDNALEMRWWPGSRVFINPPYGRAVGKFVYKSLDQSRCGRLVVLLTFARTDTSWWQDCVPHAAEVIFIRGRLRFNRGQGKSGAAPAPSAIIVFSPHVSGPPKITFMDQPHHRN